MGASGSTNKKPSIGPRQYLFTADVNVEKFRTDNVIEYVDKIEVIPDMLLYAEREGVNNGEMLPYRTNKFGYLVFDKAQHQITQPVHLLKEQSFIVPPMDMLNLSWSMNSLSSRLDQAVEKESWHKAIIDHINKSGFDKTKNSINLKIKSIPFSDMRDPKAPPKDGMPDLDKHYRQWHEDCVSKGVEKLSGYLIPRMRMVFCVFNNPNLVGAEVHLYNSSGVLVDSGVTVDAGSGAVIAVLAANKNQLSANETYKIEIDINEPIKRFSAIDKEKWQEVLISGGKYQLQEILTFGMGSKLGEYDVVMCDPITVEETLLQQFPVEYDHISRYIQGSPASENQVVHQYRGRNKQDLFGEKGIKTLVGQVQWATGKAGMVSGILASDANHKLALQLGKAINEQAAKVVPQEWKNGLNLAFQSVDVALAWKEFPENIAKGIASKIDKVSEVKMIGGMDKIAKAMTEADKLSEFEYKVYKKLTSQDYKLFDFSGKDLPDFAGKGDFWDRQFFLDDLKKHAVDTFDIKEMPPVLGNKAKKIADKIDKVMDKLKVGWALDFYALGSSWYDVLSKNSALDESCKQFQILLMDYAKKSTKEFKQHNAAQLSQEDINTNGHDMATIIPSREGIINLEKFRASSVMAGRNLDKAYVDAFSATFDLALSVGMKSGYPPAVIACAVIALVKETFVLVGSAIDYLITLPLEGDEKSKISVLNELRENSSENQDLMPESDDVLKNNGIKDLNVQFRMRAEAFYGLARLITRASASASESEAKKIQKYLDKIARMDQQEKDLGDNPDKAKLKNIVDDRNAVISDLADYRNEILKAKVEKYRIKEYIQEFILKDGWTMPIKEICTVCLDTFHLFGDDSLIDGNVRDAFIEKNSKYSDLPALPFFVGAAVDSLFDHELKANFSNAFPVHNISADSVLDLVKTFRMVQPEILRSDPVQYTCIFHRPKDMTDAKAKANGLADNGWELLNKDEHTDIDSLNEVSVLSQIRIFILLKNDPIFAENFYPFELQLSRLDGSNITGPLYKGMVHALDPKQMLTHELKVSGLDNDNGNKRYGVIFNPTFQFGSENLLGTKPMDYSSAGRIFDHGYLANRFSSKGANVSGGAAGFAEYCKRHQVVGWEVQIGNTTDFKKFIRLGRSSDADNSIIRPFTTNGQMRNVKNIKESLNHKDDIDEYRIKIDDKNDKNSTKELEAQFLNSNFLLSRGREWEMPKVLDAEDYVFGIMLKLGDNPFVFVSESYKTELESIQATNLYNKKPIKLGIVKKKSKNSRYLNSNLGLVIQNYDWKTPIEFMVLLRAGNHVEKNSKFISEIPQGPTTNLNWKNCIKLAFNTGHRSIWKRPASHKDIDGPDFQNKLYYLGKRESLGKFVPGQMDSNKDGIAPDPKVEEAYDFVKSIVEGESTDPTLHPELKSKLRTKGVSHSFQPYFEEEYHVFAAHIKPSYTVHDDHCTRINSIRPFAAHDYIPVKGQYPKGAVEEHSKESLDSVLESTKFDLVVGDGIQLSDKFPFGYYEYYLQNFATSDGTKEDSGQFNQKAWENCFAYGGLPFKLMIEAPENNYKDVPWEGLVKNDGDQKAVDAWITNDTQSVGIPASVQKELNKVATNTTAPKVSNPAQQAQSLGNAANKSTASSAKLKGKKP